MCTCATYPCQLLVHLKFALLLIIGLGFPAYFAPDSIGPLANPGDPYYLPSPDRYFCPLFEWLKLWHDKFELVRVLVISSIIVILFVGLPFIDRRLEGRPWKRPVTMRAFSLIVFISFTSLGAYSYYQDAHNKHIAMQMAQQHEMEVQYMKQPLKPQMSEPMVAEAARAEAPTRALVAEGESIFQSRGSYDWHSEGAVGATFASQLTGVGRKFTTPQAPR